MKVVLKEYNRTRNTGLDLLRIVSMLMVVTLHYLNENLGGVLKSAVGGTYYLAWSAESLCYCAVNLFVLMSGYLLCQREYTNWKKVIDLLAQVVFYSIGLYLLGCITGKTVFSIKTLLTRYLFPTTTGLWWFVTDYVILYLLAPYLNKGLKTLTQKQHRNLALLLILMLSAIPTVFFFQIDVIGLEGGYSIIWFLVLYVMASYIRYYGLCWTKGGYLAGYFGFSAVTALCKFVQNLVLHKEYFNLYSYTSVSVLGAAVCLFCFFKEINIASRNVSKAISWVASLSFAVFLIHTHPIWSGWMWDNCVRATEYMDTVWKFLGHMTVSVLGIYAVCTSIDYLRKLFFDAVGRIRMPIK